MISTEQLDVLQAAAEAATAGPWARFDPTAEECHDIVGPIGDRDSIVVYAECAPADAAFIAAWNPAVALDFLASRRAALSRIARVEALHPRIVGECHTCSDENGPKPWPCATVRALTEGEPSE